MKKAPKTGASSEPVACPLQGPPCLLLLLRGGLFLRGSFLSCALHRLILPKHQNFAIRKSQCDSYIRCFTMKVKKKMHCAVPFGFFRVALAPREARSPSRFACAARSRAENSRVRARCCTRSEDAAPARGGNFALASVRGSVTRRIFRAPPHP